MPELPEVETVCRAISPFIENQVINQIWKSTQKLREPFDPHHLQSLFFNNPLQKPIRRGRFIFIKTQNNPDIGILIHLGMTGALRCEPLNSIKKKHDHVVLLFNNQTELHFEDPRRFGFFQLTPLIKGIPQKFNFLGFEPLEQKKLTPKRFFSDLQKRNHSIKQALMDNTLITGIGNIYATESLFYARIHPLRPAHEISLEEVTILLIHIRKILLAAIQAGGSTIADFRRPDGSEGHFQQSLAVYGKKNENCPLCNTPIEFFKQHGRTSWVCPHCQK